MKIKIIPFDGYKYPPVRKHYNDAGADVYIPENVMIRPHETVKIPLNFGVEIPDGMMGLIITRSSTAVSDLLVHIPPIDSGYRGNIHCIITNLSDECRPINDGDRIGQLVILPVILADFVEDLGEKRGTGAFGSTGK